LWRLGGQKKFSAAIPDDRMALGGDSDNRQETLLDHRTANAELSEW
jgi:hypothetical protein